MVLGFCSGNLGKGNMKVFEGICYDIETIKSSVGCRVSGPNPPRKK